MNNEFKKGIDELKTIKLSRREKDEMFSALSKRIENDAVLPSAAPSPFFSFFSIKNASVFASIVALIGMASASYAAESALPGEKLYAIKVNLNEPLRGAFAISASAKASWEEEKLERRLDEAEKLASKGKLDETALVEVEKRIDMHVDDHDAWKEKDEKGSKKKVDEVAIPAAPKEEEASDSVERKIEEHREILKDIKTEKSEEEQEKIERLEKKLEEKASERKEKSDKRQSSGESDGKGKAKEGKSSK